MSIPAPRPGGAALITGASSGIGAALARGLCARGHDAILVARRRDRLESLAAELRERHGRRVEVIPCDLADADARGGLPGEITRRGLDVDVLVLSAGFGLAGPFLSQSSDRIMTMVRTNVASPVSTVPPTSVARSSTLNRSAISAALAVLRQRRRVEVYCCFSQNDNRPCEAEPPITQGMPIATCPSAAAETQPSATAPTPT